MRAFAAAWPDSPSSLDQRTPAVAFDGAAYAVLWEEGDPGNTNIVGARIDTTGVVSATNMPIAPDSGMETRPAVVRHDTLLLAAWTARDDAAQPSVIRGALLDPLSLSPIGAELSLSPFVALGDADFPTAVEDGSGATLVMYARWDFESPYGGPRSLRSCRRRDQRRHLCPRRGRLRVPPDRRPLRRRRSL